MMKLVRWLAATAAVALGVGYLWGNQGDTTVATSDPAPLTPASGVGSSPAPVLATDVGNLSHRTLLEARYNRAAQTYNSYRDSTRYPPTSRPLRDHPDQGQPFAAITNERVLQTGPGKVAKGFKLRTSQERFYLSGEESVTFKLEAVDDNGIRLPLSIRRSTAFNIADAKSGSNLLQIQLPFTDDGTEADTQLNDGLYTARLTPAQQGFADYTGTIRVTAQINVNGEDGELSFDVVYTGGVPAVWLGAREALEAGSLNFYLKAKVMVAGRYVVSGRVFDANGKPFALLQYNEEVPAGTREFKLQLFGALIKDMTPAFPLRLVDVEGFLLKPDIFPDRAMMARKTGTVLSSAVYKNAQFSSDEWTSEERTRYLNEFRSDLIKAKDALNAQNSP